jgi:hypothetical protein
LPPLPSSSLYYGFIKAKKSLAHLITPPGERRVNIHSFKKTAIKTIDWNLMHAQASSVWLKVDIKTLH